MKPVTKTFVSLIISISTFLPVFAFAQTPSLPHQFFGTVKFSNGVSAPNGMTIEAKINGTVVGNSVTANGKYGYSPSLLFATDAQGVNAGETVEFYIDGTDTKANETVVFVNGSSNQLDLTIPAPTLNPTPTPTPTPTPAPSGGGGGGDGNTSTSTLTPTPGLLSAAVQKVDANKDNKIDVLDFNTLMANWGNTGSNLADFDGNGVVNVLDFNLLMINWTS